MNDLRNEYSSVTSVVNLSKNSNRQSRSGFIEGPSRPNVILMAEAQCQTEKPLDEGKI
jgi:hypothetical protein